MSKDQLERLRNLSKHIASKHTKIQLWIDKMKSCLSMLAHKANYVILRENNTLKDLLELLLEDQGCKGNEAELR
jgi:Mg2+/Co2+ transporter CorB